ncbi:MAG: hypothetical protein EB015_10325 [Methylocystaceae bacterium]|nr:hypothetical protein [Methylocystaceae bacterium]
MSVVGGCWRRSQSRIAVLIQKNASDRIIESGVCVASQAGLTADNHEALIVMQLGKKAPKA